MNHIARLTEDLAAARAELHAMDEALQAFRIHLDLDKFRGVGVDGTPNTWIGIRDVFAWIETISAAGREAGGAR